MKGRRGREFEAVQGFVGVAKVWSKKQRGKELPALEMK